MLSRSRPSIRLAFLALVLAACGGDGGTGPGPDGANYVVEVSPGAPEVIAGRAVQLAAVLKDENGAQVTSRPGTTWSSSDPAVAVVDGTGRVTALTAGTAAITARFDGWGKSGSVQLTVRPGSLRMFADERGFWIGTAVGYTGTTFPNSAAYTTVLGREFNVLVPENVGKWGILRSDGPTSWRFQFMDEMLAFAEARGMKVRGHTLAWHAFNPAWLNALTPANTTREQAIALLTDHADSVVARYRGRIRDWDVVNEAIGDAGGARRTAAESVWERLIGPDYVEIAFRAAAAADPAARLFYNDYSIETNGAKQNAVFDLVKDLVDRGVPIHGVGFQAHFIQGSTPADAQLSASMDRFAALGLEVQLTELDIRIQGTPTTEKLAAQAEEYRRVIDVCIAHPACNTVVVWGIDDGNSWVPNTFPGFGAPLLYTSTFVPKPAYAAVQESLDLR